MSCCINLSPSVYWPQEILQLLHTHPDKVVHNRVEPGRLGLMAEEGHNLQGSYDQPCLTICYQEQYTLTKHIFLAKMFDFLKCARTSRTFSIELEGNEMNKQEIHWNLGNKRNKIWSLVIFTTTIYHLRCKITKTFRSFSEKHDLYLIQMKYLCCSELNWMQIKTTKIKLQLQTYNTAS